LTVPKVPECKPCIKVLDSFLGCSSRGKSPCLDGKITGLGLLETLGILVLLA